MPRKVLIDTFSRNKLQKRHQPFQGGGRSLAADFPGLAACAARLGHSPHVLLLAWMRHRWPGTLIPLVGCRAAARLPCPGAVEAVRLTGADLEELEFALRKASRGAR